MHDDFSGGFLMKQRRHKKYRTGVAVLAYTIILGCLPRNNPYDPVNPDFVMPRFSCTVHLLDDSTRGKVNDATIAYRYNGLADSTTADSGGNAIILVEDNVAGSRIPVNVYSIESPTYRSPAPFTLTLSRDGRDTTILLRDRNARSVPWDTLLTHTDQAGAHLVWHASDSDDFLYYRAVRINPLSGAIDTIEKTINVNDTVFIDRGVAENEVRFYRIDVVSSNGTTRIGRELRLALPNRFPAPARIVNIEPDFFIYLRLRWIKNSDPDFFAYTLYRSTDSVTFDSVYTTVNRDDTVWLDTTIDTAACRYYYYMTTVDSARFSSAGDIVSGVNRVTLDSGLLYIHEGIFTMGRSGSAGIPLNQQPAHTIYLSSFLIDRYEVTVKRYVAFLNAGNENYYNDSMASIGITRNGDLFSFDVSRANHPIVWVSWSDADTLCKWSGGKLPTEAQWEKASRGTDGRLYPWGQSFYLRQVSPEYFLANYAVGLIAADDSGYSIDGARYAAPVGNYATGVSPWGIYDLAGNVSEWCGDWYANAFPSDTIDPKGPELGLWRSYRGGSFQNYPEELMSTNRFRFDPSSGKEDLGCRCVYETQ
jgi:formylglycine-generating enzyme required for sulfatase activity